VPFSNPITGAQGALNIPAIKSPNYVPHVSGWTIDRDGSAEFNNLTVRGTFQGTEYTINSSGIYFYAGVPGAGNPPLFYVTSVAADPYGNTLNGTVGIFGGTGIFNLNTDATDYTTLADGLIQHIAGGVLASQMQFSASNPAGVNEIYAEAISNFGLGNAGFRLIAQFNSGILPVLQLALNTSILANDPNQPDNTAEIWHDMRPLLNSFTGTVTGQFPPQYRLNADGWVDVAGYVQTPPGGSSNYNGVVFCTLPNGYRASGNNGHKWFASGIPNGASCPVVQVDSGGNLALHNIPVTGAGSVLIGIYGRFPLNKASGGMISS
jgi:hypothetical protein